MKHKLDKRRTTSEDTQRLQELRSHCQKAIGVDFYDASGNLQLSVRKAGKELIVSKTGILVTKLTRHHYRHKIMESIDLLFLKPDEEAIEIHGLSCSDLRAKILNGFLALAQAYTSAPFSMTSSWH